MAQIVKNLPAVWETLVRSLGWEDPLEKGEATHSSILAWEIPWMSMEKGNATPVFLSGESERQRSLVGYGPCGCKGSLVKIGVSGWNGP